jgi:hypothetical protein
MCVYLFCVFQIVFLNCDRYVEFHAQVCNLKLRHFIVNIFLQHMHNFQGRTLEPPRKHGMSVIKQIL